MKKLLLLATLAIATPVFAQQAPPELTLKVTVGEVDTIGKGLGKLPFDEVAGLIQKLRTQITEQQQAANPNQHGNVVNNSGVVTQGQKGDNNLPKPEEKK